MHSKYLHSKCTNKHTNKKGSTLTTQKFKHTLIQTINKQTNHLYQQTNKHAHTKYPWEIAF